MTPEMFEKELAGLLFQYAYGRLSVAEAEKKAKEAAPNLVKNMESFGHKGLNWYAQELVAVI